MTQITYEDKPRSILVKLDGKKCGAIHPSKGGGYHYARSPKNWGDTFATVEEVKRSIEGDDA